MGTILDTAKEIALRSREKIEVTCTDEDDVNYYCNVTDGTVTAPLTLKKSIMEKSRELMVRRAISSAMAVEYLRLDQVDPARKWIRWETESA